MRKLYTLKQFDASLYHDGYTRLLYSLALLLLVGQYVTERTYSSSPWFWAIIVVAVVYDLGAYFIKAHQILTEAWTTVSVHLLLFTPLIVFFIPVGAPLELIGFVIALTATYLLGKPGFAITFVSVGTLYWMADLYQLTSDQTGIELTAKILMLFIACGLIYRYTVVDRKEREQLVTFSTEANIERQRITSLINSMADAVIATDPDGNIQLYNGAALILLNTNSTLTDQNLSNHIKLRDKEDQEVDIIKLAQAKNRIIQRDDLLYTNNLDEDINIYLDLAPVRSIAFGEPDSGYIILLRDITKQKSIEEQRDEFISIISHELRTPITIAEANISTAMLPSTKTRKKQLEFMEQAHKNVLFLASLVNDITLLAHAEQGRLNANLQPHNPKQIAEDLFNDYKKQAKDDGLELKLKVDKGLKQVSTNQERLGEVLQDFITNAIKYTNTGTVTIAVSQKGPKHVRFAITDSGIGISRSDQAHVFEKFYRSEDYKTREHSGTGLGLYIAKRLAELINAKLGVESKVGSGSTFYVDVPTV